MLERLIEHLAALDSGSLSRATLQDVAVSFAWYNSYPPDSAEFTKWSVIPSRVETWIAATRTETAPTEGRRHQWVIRDLADVLRDAGATRLETDELNFLAVVYELAERASAGGAFDRIRSLLSEYIAAIRLCLANEPPVQPGLPSLGKRLHVVSEADLQSAKLRDIQVFAGLPIPHRGPVYANRSGHVKVLGSVPEECMLVVENGSCSVDGFIMGKLAVTRHCEVRENISGVVVTRMGDVRARNIIMPAVVVSKWGRIHCRRAEFPDRVFAGKEIHVEENVVMGRYFSPAIRVRGEIQGGEFHLSRLIAASQFRATDTRPLSIVIKRELTCSDYGEEPGPEAVKLITQGIRLRRQLANLVDARIHANQEAERNAKLAVIYLCGGESNHPIADRIHECESRIVQMQRVLSGLKNLRIAAEDRLERLSRFPGATVPHAALSDMIEQNQANLEAVRQELSVLESFEKMDLDLHEEVKALTEMRNALTLPQRDPTHVVTLMAEIWEHITRWAQEFKALESKIRDYETQLQDILGENAAAAGEKPDSISHAAVLKRLLTVVRERGNRADDPLVRRFKTGFVRVATRNVTSSLERAHAVGQEISACQDELQRVSKRLREEFQLSIGDEGEKEHPIRISGRFASGVKIYADPYSFSARVASGHGVLNVRDSGGKVVSFGKVSGEIVEIS
ncbi:MAG: hypothetical protein AMXMBFR84_31420 [Candidatus Hydrogenedentota bacterium]